MILIGIVSLLAAVVIAPAALYLGLLGALGRREMPSIHADPGPRFALVVPAHNEQASIAATVASLQEIDYPEALRQICVIADNCIDRTAAVARAAGASIIVREDRLHPGKGAALEYAFDHILSATDVDAVVVVDADTIVSPNLLNAFSTQLAAGAHAIQAEYGVRNVNASWRTRLMTLALALFHRTRSSARSRLGLSVGLRGNGMCFSRELLTRCPHRAYGLVEDLEYGIHIGLAGYRVAYAGESRVLGEMAASSGAAASQRRRWEHGRAQLARTLLGRLVREAWRQKSPMLLDLAIDLAIPPLTYVGLLVAGGFAVDAYLSPTVYSAAVALYLWGISAVGLLIYVARGLKHSELGWRRAVGTLIHGPVYFAWRLVAVGPRPAGAWIRTRREAEKTLRSRA